MQCNCVEVVEKQAAEIEKLKWILDKFSIYPCDSCDDYHDSDTLRVCHCCRCQYCENCYIYCRSCNEYYCYTCRQIEYGDKSGWHLEKCTKCSKVKCVANECYFCQKKVCTDCISICKNCYHEFCSTCLRPGICLKQIESCRGCHLQKCSQCFQPEDFKYLPGNDQYHILMLLLVFKRLNHLIIPPKFVKNIIFRHIIHHKIDHPIYMGRLTG